jgi:lysophospholipase L1-like esterase
MKRLLTVLSIGALCVVPATAAAAATTGAETKRSLNVVALGDSYASGVGAGDYQDGTVGGCFRSANSYSAVIVERLRKRGKRVAFTNVTCSGASISALRTSFRGEKPQFDALRRNTDLVLLTIGANDVDFDEYGEVCIQADCSGAPGKKVLSALPAMTRDLTAALRGIKARSPRAQIILAGYGQQVAPGANAKGAQLDPICAPEVFSAAERREGALVSKKLDLALRRAAVAAQRRGVNVEYVSPYSGFHGLHPSFAGHSLCDRKPQFYRGFDALAEGQEGPLAVLHLNKAGHAALANLADREVRVRPGFHGIFG